MPKALFKVLAITNGTTETVIILLPKSIYNALVLQTRLVEMACETEERRAHVRNFSEHMFKYLDSFCPDVELDVTQDRLMKESCLEIPRDTNVSTDIRVRQWAESEKVVHTSLDLSDEDAFDAAMDQLASDMEYRLTLQERRRRATNWYTVLGGPATAVVLARCMSAVLLVALVGKTVLDMDVLTSAFEIGYLNPFTRIADLPQSIWQAATMRSWGNDFIRENPNSGLDINGVLRAIMFNSDVDNSATTDDTIESILWDNNELHSGRLTRALVWYDSRRILSELTEWLSTLLRPEEEEESVGTRIMNRAYNVAQFDYAPIAHCLTILTLLGVCGFVPRSSRVDWRIRTALNTQTVITGLNFVALAFMEHAASATNMLLDETERVTPSNRWMVEGLAATTIAATTQELVLHMTVGERSRLFGAFEYSVEYALRRVKHLLGEIDQRLLRANINRDENALVHNGQ